MIRASKLVTKVEGITVVVTTHANCKRFEGDSKDCSSEFIVPTVACEVGRDECF